MSHDAARILNRAYKDPARNGVLDVRDVDACLRTRCAAARAVLFAEALLIMLRAAASR